MRIRLLLFVPLAVAAALGVATLPAQGQLRVTAASSEAAAAASDLGAALTPEDWRRVDEGVERALAWLARNQQADGSFPSLDVGQPAVTSLCVMAFLSCGRQPGSGPYGDTIDRGIDFVLSCQQQSGLFSLTAPEAFHVHQGSSHAASYNHAIAGLMLTEAYGQVSPERSARIAQAVVKGLQFTGRLQLSPVKDNPADGGGWRYMWKPGSHTPSDSDLSVTGWHLMFLRSAKNAQFQVPDELVADALAYVERCFDERQDGFVYGLFGVDRYVSRGTMGVGALSLALGGKHDTPMAHRVGEWVLTHPFDTYGDTTHMHDRFHYSAYYCSNAMAQLGGEYWRGTFPALARTLLDNQAADGSWYSETGQDAMYGSAYPTALSVLTLTPAYQLLPIYQR